MARAEPSRQCDRRREDVTTLQNRGSDRISNNARKQLAAI